MKMTEQQINMEIAKVCGWKPNTSERWVKNYCNDLNAMHEAEKMLLNDFSKQQTYLEELGWEDDSMATIITMLHTTARQRAEAFLRTLGKWEE